MSDERSGNSPKWGRAIRRGSDDPARSEFIGLLLKKHGIGPARWPGERSLEKPAPASTGKTGMHAENRISRNKTGSGWPKGGLKPRAVGPPFRRTPRPGPTPRPAERKCS